MSDDEAKKEKEKIPPLAVPLPNRSFTIKEDKKGGSFSKETIRH